MKNLCRDFKSFNSMIYEDINQSYPLLTSGSICLLNLEISYTLSESECLSTFFFLDSIAASTFIYRCIRISNTQYMYASHIYHFIYYKNAGLNMKRILCESVSH